MKSINAIKKAALVGLLFSGLAPHSNAQTVTSTSETLVSDSKLSVVEVKPLQFRVSYIPQSKTVILRIIDTEKNVLFTESRRPDSLYLKYFDLSTLLDGTYTFEVTDGKETLSQSFDILTTTTRVVSSF